MLDKFDTRLFMSPKTWAQMMVMKNFVLGLAIIIGGSVWASEDKVLEAFKMYFTCSVVVGVVNIVAGVVLVVAMVKGKENLVLLYILLEFVILFILSIFTAMINLEPDLSIGFLAIFLVTMTLWIGLYNVYYFYLELQAYNNNSVCAGVQEIACNTQPHHLESFPEKAVDTTTV